ncbi:hypothetical protein JYG34_15945 [Pseudomonas entomophila]|uniref:hypothetical protein n=1 Tax=Pseudomonas entomophila TaxID=312306 RepID=UPI001BCBEEB8|nr:hypothetical protein [Pseudomonas entomophila]QVM89518.1 hypothetical protein JYG34_15945 [Pseudomonas entomophila]
MIDVSGWPANLRIAILLVPFLTGLAGLAINAHIAASRHFDVMCAALKRSPCLHEELKRGGGYTLKFRSLTVSSMAGALCWPALSIRKGSLDPEDYKNFPVYLKTRMKVASYCMLIALAWAAFIMLFLEF